MSVSIFCRQQHNLTDWVSYTRSFIVAHGSEIQDLRATSDGLLGGGPNVLQGIIEISRHICFSWSLFCMKSLGSSHGGSVLIGASNSKTPAQLYSFPASLWGLFQHINLWGGHITLYSTTAFCFWYPRLLCILQSKSDKSIPLRHKVNFL